GRGRVAAGIGHDHDGVVPGAVDGTVQPAHGRTGEPHAYGTLPSVDLLGLARPRLVGLEPVRPELVLRLVRPRGSLVDHHQRIRPNGAIRRAPSEVSAPGLLPPDGLEQGLEVP